MELSLDASVIEGNKTAVKYAQLEALVFDLTTTNIDIAKKLIGDFFDSSEYESINCMISIASQVRQLQKGNLATLYSFLSSVYKGKSIFTSQFVKNAEHFESVELKFPKRSLEYSFATDNLEEIVYHDALSWFKEQKYSDKTMPALSLAAYCGSSKIFKYFLANGEALSNDVLKASIMGGNDDIVQICAQYNGNYDGLTNVAIEYHRNEIAQWIINNYGFEPVSLSICISRSNTIAFYYFLKSGVSVDQQDRRGKSPIIYAISMKRNDLFKELIDMNANIETKDKSNSTPLIFTLSNEYYDECKYLIEHNANIEKKNSLLCSPLYIAIEKGNMEIAQILISKGAEINAKNKKGETPFSVAIKKKNYELAKLLISSGANINQKNNSGLSPLYSAAHHNEIDTVNFLIGFHADFEVKNVKGFTPLYGAIFGGYPEMAEYLISKGAKFDPEQQISQDALFHTIFLNLPQSVQYLLDKGTNIECRNSDDMTPLLYATTTQRISIVSNLCKRGCDLEAKNTFNQTSVLVARLLDNQKLVEILLSYGAINYGGFENSKETQFL